MATRPVFDAEARRRRLARRHRLVDLGTSVLDAVDSVVALHASDPASVHLAAWCRTEGATTDALIAALEDERSLVRLHGMRRTIWVVARDTAAELQAACAPIYHQRERRTLATLVDEDPGDHPPDLVERAEAAIVAHLAAVGSATAAELSAAVPEAALQLVANPGTAYEGRVGLGSRLLTAMGMAGTVVRGPVQGSWISGTHAWSLPDRWLDPPLDELDPDDAAARLLARYLARFGPVTEADAVWWTGWTKGRTRRALVAVAAVEVDLDDGTTGWVAAGDDDPDHPDDRVDGPWAALLPGLDPTTMGWKQRDWYLPADPGPGGADLFDRNGNGGPAVVVDGRIVGAWGQTPDAEVVWALAPGQPDLGRDRTALVDDRAAALTTWLGGVRVMPRFPTALQRRLHGG